MMSADPGTVLPPAATWVWCQLSQDHPDKISKGTSQRSLKKPRACDAQPGYGGSSLSSGTCLDAPAAQIYPFIPQGAGRVPPVPLQHRDCRGPSQGDQGTCLGNTRGLAFHRLCIFHCFSSPRQRARPQNTQCSRTPACSTACMRAHVCIYTRVDVFSSLHSQS